MKKIISLLLAVVMCVGCLAMLSSCSAPEDDGAHINVYLGNQVYDFDPTDYYADSNAEQVLALLYEPLFYLNDKGQLQNAVASNWWVDEVERTINIELKETYWSDGSRVKADDFIYAWVNRILDPNHPNPAASLLYDIENAAAAKTGECSPSEVGVKRVDPYRLEITYRADADYNNLLVNLASVATSPVKQDSVTTAPTYWSKSISTLVTNGPFKMSVMDVVGGEFTLARNVGYHQYTGAVDYDNIVVPGELNATFTASGSEIEVSYADIEAKATFIMSDATLADRLAQKENAIVADDASVYTYVFNTNKKLFSYPQVRQALTLAIDRAAIVEAVVFGKAADGFLPDICGGSDETLISSSADMEKAEELLSEVDLSNVSKKFTLTIADDEESKAIAEIVCDAWEELGFDVTVKCAETQETGFGSGQNEITVSDSGIQTIVKEASYGNAEFDVLAVDWQLYSGDAFVGLSAFSTAFSGCGMNMADSSQRVNISGWVNNRYNELLTAAYKSTGEDRAAMLSEAEKLLVESAPVCPIIYNESFMLVSSEISGVYVDGVGNFAFNSTVQSNYHDYLEKEPAEDVSGKEDENGDEE